MPFVTSLISWLWILVVVVLLAIALMTIIPTGAIVQILAHAALLVGGAAIVLGLRPR